MAYTKLKPLDSGERDTDRPGAQTMSDENDLPF